MNEIVLVNVSLRSINLVDSFQKFSPPSVHLMEWMSYKFEDSIFKEMCMVTESVFHQDIQYFWMRNEWQTLFEETKNDCLAMHRLWQTVSAIHSGQIIMMFRLREHSQCQTFFFLFIINHYFCTVHCIHWFITANASLCWFAKQKYKD